MANFTYSCVFKLGVMQCVFETQASISPGKEVVTAFQRKEEGA